MSWDDRDVVSKQIERLEKERDELRTAVEAQREALKEKQTKRDQQAKILAARRRARSILAIAIGQLLLAALGVGIYTYATYLEAETLRGHVDRLRGPAPAMMGDPCSLAIEPAYFPYNATFRIDCGGQRIYGHESFGHIRCETRAQRATSCVDDDAIGDGGDPRVRFDRARGRIDIDDGSRWAFSIALPR
jgi:hypothetical protein